MTKSNRILAAIAACLVALAGLAGVAEAAKKKQVQTATFKATLSGSQVTTWEYHDPKTDDPCDGSADGYGDQTLRFTAGKPFKVTFYKPPKGQPDLIGTDGRPGVVPEPALRLSFTAERNGEFTPHNDVTACDGDNGGGVEPQHDKPQDCGERSALSAAGQLYFNEGTSRSADDDLFVPIEAYPEKDHLKLKTLTDPIYVDPRDGSGTNLDGTYANCPFLLEDASIPEDGDIYTSAHKIPERRLFDKRRKRLVLSGDDYANHRQGYTSGKTILAWNLRLTRVK